MSNTRAHELADQFRRLNDEIVAFVQGCPQHVWQSPCADDGRTVGVVAHHIASSYALIVQLLTLVINGQPVPSITPALLDQANADHSQRHADCTSDEVIELLRTNGEAAVLAIDELTGAQLARRATSDLFGSRMSAEEVVEQVLIGHAAAHFARLQAAAA